MNKGKLGPLNDSQMGKHQWMFMVKLIHMGLKKQQDAAHEPECSHVC